MLDLCWNGRAAAAPGDMGGHVGGDDGAHYGARTHNLREAARAGGLVRPPDRWLRWALVLLAFVGGMDDLLFMDFATIAMVLEKLPEIGRPPSRPLGFAFLGAEGAALIGGMR